MKVREMWDNESIPTNQRSKEKERRTNALTHELRTLLNRQQQMYDHLKATDEVLPPEDSNIAWDNRGDWIMITTIRHMGIPSNFFIPYTEENEKTEQIFKKIAERAEKIKALLTQTALTNTK
jgi:hypothetical protein